MDPFDPDKDSRAMISEPSEPELRDLRRIVRERLDGVVYKDRHSGRMTRIKQAPGKFKSIGVSLTNCDRDHVLVDIPVEGMMKPQPLRICLVCDAGREMLGLPA
jgi:hypothetical protein